MREIPKTLNSDRGLFPLNELTARSAEFYSKAPALRVWRDERYQEWNYRELHENVTAIANWLIESGIKENDHVAILGDNSPEWAMSYLGIQVAGGVCIPIDRMLPASGIRHILADSQARMLFASQSFHSLVNDVEDVSTLETKIDFDDSGKFETLSFKEILSKGKKLHLKFPKRTMEDLAAILYTSGTTGHSKGVMLSQMNIVSNFAGATQLFKPDGRDTFLSVLPIHHSFEATAGFLFPLYNGSSITYAKSLKSTDIVGGIKDTNVTVLVGVPLLFEKMQQGILRNVKKKGKATQFVFNSLLGIVKFGELFGLKLGFPLFKSIRVKGGLNSIILFLSAGGPLDPQIAEFFNRIGLRMIEGYGLTETSPCITLTSPAKIINGSVGPALPGGVEFKVLDADENGIGEIVSKGPNVFQGYYKNEEATKATFTEDGWFKTGDLGKELKNGYLKITGRKKSMLVTAGGKNVFPEEIEFYLNRSEFIAESVVLGIPRGKGVGDEVGALVHPDYEQIDLYFETQNIDVNESTIYDLIKKEINIAQESLSSYKRIKTFRIFENEFQKTTKRTIKRFLYTGDMLNVDDK
jgi:long-chain acyl-CoA synthetase